MDTTPVSPRRRRSRGEYARLLIVATLARCAMDHQRPPSERELADACTMDRGTLRYHLLRLIEDGVVQRKPGMRGIILVEEIS